MKNKFLVCIRGGLMYLLDKIRCHQVKQHAKMQDAILYDLH
jgi:hypothetical protein